MLIWLTKRARVRVAKVFVALFAACVILPSVALAYADGTTAAHCLEGEHGVKSGKTHVHADGASHKHLGDDTLQNGSDSDGVAVPTTCCGLFCLAALPVDAGVTTSEPICSTPISELAAEGLSGREPNRINRPPISLLSL